MTLIQGGRKYELASTTGEDLVKVQVEKSDEIHSHVTGNGGVSGHRLGGEVVVAVGSVEE